METNNKLREALMQIYDRVNSLDEDCAVDPVEIRDIAKAALARPLRNCDVGTAEQQLERFKHQCFEHHTGRCSPHCRTLPAKTRQECTLKWAQMPYNEGADK